MQKADFHRLSPVDLPPTLFIYATRHTSVSRRLMNVPNPAPQHTIGSLRSTRTRRLATVTQHEHAASAANDDAPTTVDFFQNPLWIMAIALGVFGAVAALVVAFA